MQPVMCLKCQGSGIDLERSNAMPGRLMPLCQQCQGSGQFAADGQVNHYRATFLVGSRFIVRITIPRMKGYFVEMDVDWSPRMPSPSGKGRLKPTERRDYEAGRTEAMQQFMQQMGGGEFSLIEAGARH